MSYYLLKSTRDRQQMGDAFIDLEKIVYITPVLRYQGEQKAYLLIIQLEGGARFNALFNTSEEIKNVMKEILVGELDDEYANSVIEEMIFQYDEEMEKKIASSSVGLKK